MKTSKSKITKQAQILDGQKLAEEIELDLAKEINTSGKRPGLAAILVGDDPASELYIKLKEKDVGIQIRPNQGYQW